MMETASREVYIEPTKAFLQLGSEEYLLGLESPLVVVTNSTNGKKVWTGDKVRMFSVFEAGGRPLTTRFLNRKIGWIHQFAVLSRDIPYLLWRDKNISTTSQEFNARVLETLIQPEIELNSSFEHQMKFNAGGDFYREVNALIKREVHAAAVNYAEKFALDNGFGIIVDRVSKPLRSYSIKHTKAYEEREGVVSSTNLPIGQTA